VSTALVLAAAVQGALVPDARGEEALTRGAATRPEADAAPPEAPPEASDATPTAGAGLAPGSPTTDPASFVADAEDSPRPDAARAAVALLVVRTSGGPAAWRAAADTCLRTAAADAGVWADPVTLGARRDTDHVAAAAERATTLRTAARGRILAFDFDGAASALEAARESLLAEHADLFGDLVLDEIDLELARALLDAGERDRSTAILRGLARRRPDRAPSPDHYPPRLLDLWRELLGAPDDGAPPAPQSNVDPLRLAAAARRIGIAYAVAAEVVAAPLEGAEAVLTIVNADTGAVVGTEHAPFDDPESCGLAARAAIGRLLAPLRPRPPRTTPPPPPTGTILVLSNPPGAGISLDGEGVSAATPATLTVAPGRHRITLTLADHHDADVAVTVWRDQTRPVEVSLAAVAARTPRRRLWWVWTIVGVAAAGAAAAIVSAAVSSSRELPTMNVEIVQAITGDRGSDPR
jgi:hypothetical protein